MSKVSTERAVSEEAKHKRAEHAEVDKRGVNKHSERRQHSKRHEQSEPREDHMSHEISRHSERPERAESAKLLERSAKKRGDCRSKASGYRPSSSKCNASDSERKLKRSEVSSEAKSVSVSSDGERHARSERPCKIARPTANQAESTETTTSADVLMQSSSEAKSSASSESEAKQASEACNEDRHADKPFDDDADKQYGDKTVAESHNEVCMHHGRRADALAAPRRRVTGKKRQGDVCSLSAATIVDGAPGTHASRDAEDERCGFEGKRATICRRLTGKQNVPRCSTNHEIKGIALQSQSPPRGARFTGQRLPRPIRDGESLSVPTSACQGTPRVRERVPWQVDGGSRLPKIGTTTTTPCDSTQSSSKNGVKRKEIEVDNKVRDCIKACRHGVNDKHEGGSLAYEQTLNYDASSTGVLFNEGADAMHNTNVLGDRSSATSASNLLYISKCLNQLHGGADEQCVMNATGSSSNTTSATRGHDACDDHRHGARHKSVPRELVNHTSNDAAGPPMSREQWCRANRAPIYSAPRGTPLEALGVNEGPV